MSAAVSSPATEPTKLADPCNRTVLFEEYKAHNHAFDELFHGKSPHSFCKLLVERLGLLTTTEFQDKRSTADLVFINHGITFSVYSDRRGTEKIFPFDLVPRPVAGHEWDRLEGGLVQRIRALNLFLDDVYHDQRILKEHVIPSNLVLAVKGFPSQVGG